MATPFPQIKQQHVLDQPRIFHRVHLLACVQTACLRAPCFPDVHLPACVRHKCEVHTACLRHTAHPSHCAPAFTLRTCSHCAPASTPRLHGNKLGLHACIGKLQPPAAAPLPLLMCVSHNSDVDVRAPTEWPGAAARSCSRPLNPSTAVAPLPNSILAKESSLLDLPLKKGFMGRAPRPLAHVDHKERFDSAACLRGPTNPVVHQAAAHSAC